ncbi:hypothetical protein, partial [Legionella pneumophila]|uniref:hypothetical protein n=1 Tax=Legionella pneumophila TaxID=446 RepID=UPI000B2FA1A0
KSDKFCSKYQLDDGSYLEVLNKSYNNKKKVLIDDLLSNKTQSITLDVCTCHRLFFRFHVD